MAGSDYDVSVVVLRVILDGAAATGIEPGAVLAEIGLSRATLDDPRARIPRELEEGAWMSVLRRSARAAAVGALGAARMQRGAFGLLEYAARTAATVGKAIEVLVRHSALLHGVPLFTVDAANALSVQYHLPHDAEEPYAPPAAELALGSMAIILRDASSTGRGPEAIEIAHSRSDHDLEELFGTRVGYERNRYALSIAVGRADEPMREAEPPLHAILVDQLERERRTAGRDSFDDRVRRIVEQQLLLGAPSLARVAKRLGMAPRTVQAHLGGVGSSFREVVSQARLERAKLYLCATSMSIASVAALAGYSDERSLYRAFRRSLGTTPDAARRAGRARRKLG
jgi:AraC-like DNA-binding protein